MKKKSSRRGGASIMLTDSSIPLEHRRQMLRSLCAQEGEKHEQIVDDLLDAATNTNGEALHAKKAEELSEVLEALKGGPLRVGTFLVLHPANGAARRANVILEGGDATCPVVSDQRLGAELEAGDAVTVDLKTNALVGRAAMLPPAGQVVRFRRVLSSGRIEVSIRDQDEQIFYASAPLLRDIEQGTVEPGRALLACSRSQFAFEPLPQVEGVDGYRYLARTPVPDVVASRDIGGPPPYLDETIDYLRSEMIDPSRRRRYGLRRSQTKLLCGVSGSGKSLSIQALWNAMYFVMSEVTGVPVDDLPPRVLRLRMPKVLSKWLGESDRNIDRFFDEVEALAAETFTAPDGQVYELPVLVIGEEIDGLARARGQGDPVYDRIQTTALERFDTNCDSLRDRLVIFLFTTNVPHLVDPAFLRRAGGTMEVFGRLSRRAFEAVLSKQVNGLPLARSLGPEAAVRKKQLVREVSAWLYASNGEDKDGLVELTYVGTTVPDKKRRRDVMTGALVDRAVQQAAAVACRAERVATGGKKERGVTPEMLKQAIDSQVRSIIDQLTPANAENYLTIPDDVRVSTVRRIDPPAVPSFQLRRTP